MLLLAIYGSPRKNGNTDLMTDSFVEGAQSAAKIEVERLYIRDLGISGCLGCGYCDKHGVCAQKDDMRNVYPLLEKADRIVMASPIYFYGISGQAKLFVDRSQALFMRKQINRAEGAAASPAAARKGFFLCAGATRGKRLFDCPVLTARYFFDAIDVAYEGELCFRELDEKGAVRNHPSALDDCRRQGAVFVL
ncbi:MAG: flavodoxin family protein [Syntrophobacteraceae bacterium]|nr:flavodoxin family protein [Syntrophobacteraceae bacterium]